MAYIASTPIYTYFNMFIHFFAYPNEVLSWCMQGIVHCLKHVFIMTMLFTCVSVILCIQASGSRAHKSASETNLSSLASGPHPPPVGLSVSASSSASSSTDQLSMLSPTEGVQGRSTDMSSVASIVTSGCALQRYVLNQRAQS